MVIIHAFDNFVALLQKSMQISNNLYFFGELVGGADAVFSICLLVVEGRSNNLKYGMQEFAKVVFKRCVSLMYGFNFEDVEGFNVLDIEVYYLLV